MGLEQAAKALPSRLHVKVLPASVAVKLKLALVLLVSADGLAVIVVSGDVTSIVQVKLAGVASVLPSVSVARTWKV
jgi:adenine deaminase